MTKNYVYKITSDRVNDISYVKATNAIEAIESYCKWWNKDECITYMEPDDILTVERQGDII